MSLSPASTVGFPIRSITICSVTAPHMSKGCGWTVSCNVTLPTSQSSLDGVYSTFELVGFVRVPVPLNAAMLHCREDSFSTVASIVNELPSSSQNSKDSPRSTVTGGKYVIFFL